MNCPNGNGISEDDRIITAPKTCDVFRARGYTWTVYDFVDGIVTFTRTDPDGQNLLGNCSLTDGSGQLRAAK